MPITDDSTVTLHFELRLPDGDVIDSTFENKPGTLKIGDGSLFAGFERCLIGLESGDEQEFSISPEDAFGQHNPSNIQRFKRSEFDMDELSEGMMINFADASQAELTGVISTIDGDRVFVDFNHPLAGKELLFRVSILSVE